MPIVINGSGTVTGISAGGLPDNIITNAEMADDSVGIADLSATGTASSSTFLRGDNTWNTPSGGKITRVIQSIKTDTDSEATTQYAYADIDGTDADGSGSVWQLTITPASSSHKILLHYEVTFGQVGQTYHGFRLLKTQGGTTSTVAGGTGSVGDRVPGIFAGYRHANFIYGQDKVAGTVLDSPGVDTAVVYKIQMMTGNTSSPIYLNRSAADSDGVYEVRSVSNLVAMEIAP